LIKRTAFGLAHEGIISCHRWDLHDDTTDDFFHTEIGCCEIWCILLVVLVLESRDLFAMHAHTTSVSGSLLFRSLIFVQTNNCNRRQDRPPAVVTAARAENRTTIPFPISGCVGLCRPIQEGWELPLPSVTVIHATNNSHRRSCPSVRQPTTITTRAKSRYFGLRTIN
jgi:hypothetical protein